MILAKCAIIPDAHLLAASLVVGNYKRAHPVRSESNFVGISCSMGWKGCTCAQGQNVGPKMNRKVFDFTLVGEGV